MKKKTLLFVLYTIFFSVFANAQIKQDSIALYLPFDGNMTDASGKNVTFTESTGKTLSYVAGKFGSAAVFDSVSFLSSGLNFVPLRDFTIAAWIRMPKLATDITPTPLGQTWIHQMDVGGQSPGRIHMEVTYFNPLNAIGSFSQGIRNDFTSDTLHNNTWYYFTSVNSTADGKRYLYINGHKKATATIGTENNTGQIVLGSNKQRNGLYVRKGLIDDLLIVRQALDSATINNMMINGAIPVTGITVNSAGNVTSVLLNQTLQMSTDMLPANATNKTVTWSVTNGTGAATINASGLLQPTGAGTVTVKATANDASGIFNTKIITINPVLVSNINVKSAGDAISVLLNQTLQMSVDVLPVDATDKTVTWSVTNGTGTATINASGLLQPTAIGTVDVKATANDGSAVLGTKTITVTNTVVPVTGITVKSAGDETSVILNQTLQISVDVLPVDATNKTVTWSVTNGTGTATINASGLLQPTGVGTVTVKATANDASGLFNTKDITINPVLVSGITVKSAGDATSVLLTQTLQMSVDVLPADAANKNVTWSVTNGSGTATISTNGLLQPTGKGTVVVKATAADGSAVFGTKDITINSGLGINELAAAGIVVSPNPVSNTLKITGKNIKGVEITNLNGKAVLATKVVNETIDVSALNKGLYIVKIKTANDIILTTKIAKQ